MKHKKKSMTKYLACLFGFVLLLAAIIPYDWSYRADIVQSIEASSETDSGLRFSERMVQQKPVNTGDISRGSVTVENISDKVITNVTVMSNCSCSVVDLSKTVLNPKESISVDFSINTAGRNGDFVNNFVLRYLVGEQSRFDVFYVTVPVRSQPAAN